ncbi:MAG: GNAT family N-acetyltransferase [Oligoflexales bacterium]
MEIRLENSGDHESIRNVNDNAFETSSESEIVDKLRSLGELLLSLVAVVDGEIVGHIAFSPMNMNGFKTKFVGLGPMAVIRSQQRYGVGSALVKEGIKNLKEQGYSAAFVLGHPEYYPRFGFKPSFSNFEIKSKYDVPDNVFMAFELQEGALSGVSGLVQYSKAFG